MAELGEKRSGQLYHRLPSGLHGGEMRKTAIQPSVRQRSRRSGVGFRERLCNPCSPGTRPGIDQVCSFAATAQINGATMHMVNAEIPARVGVGRLIPDAPWQRSRWLHELLLPEARRKRRPYTDPRLPCDSWQNHRAVVCSAPSLRSARSDSVRASRRNAVPIIAHYFQKPSGSRE